MAIEKRIHTCIGTSEIGFLRVRLSLMLVDGDSGHRIARSFHSMDIEPGADLAAARARIEADLAAGWIEKQVWPRIPEEQWRDVEAHAAIVHKPAVVVAYQAAQRARLEALAGQEAAPV